MELKGYKAFNSDCTNRNGRLFEEEKTYTVEGPLKFGIKGNGFHFCKRLEDTLRYFDAMDGEIKIAEVTSLADFVKYDDDNYEYYDMYAARTIRIDRFLSRDEIINMFYSKSIPEYRIKRFIQGFRLTAEEIENFKLLYEKDQTILWTISYYQEGNKELYTTSKAKIYTKGILK